MNKVIDFIAKISGNDEINYPIYRNEAGDFNTLYYAIDLSVSPHYFDLRARHRSINMKKI
jgi:hypothetical protein